MSFPLVIGPLDASSRRSITVSVGYRRFGWRARLLPVIVVGVMAVWFTDAAIRTGAIGVGVGFALVPWTVDLLMRPVRVQVVATDAGVSVTRRFGDRRGATQVFSVRPGECFSVAEPKRLLGLKVNPWDEIEYGAERVRIPWVFRFQAAQVCAVLNECLGSCAPQPSA